MPGDSTWARMADSLYKAGKYFESSIAWERMLFENEDRADQYTAVMGKTQCLKQQGLYDDAVHFLEAWQGAPFPDSNLATIHYQQALCNYLGAHFETVLSLADRWPYAHHGEEQPSMLVVLKILSLNELQRWKEAGDVYHAFLARHHPDTLLADLYLELPHLKSVKKAQTLATFIPGAGQFYAGKPGEAIFSILVQGAGIWFGVASFQQGYYISAWLVGAALFGAFHLGSVRRSEVLVERSNRRKMLAFNEKVRNQLLAISATRAAR